jgi:predicted FMN-binding regulatory protein PaiB
MALIHIFDGAKSAVAAVLTVAITGVPAWFTHAAVQASVAPLWAYVAVAALGFVGLVMTFAFLRKAAGGVSPGRTRRR